MNFWIWRGLLVVGCAAIAYFQVAQTGKGLAIGLAVGAALVVVELLIESVQLMTLITAVVGAAAGMILAKLVDYVVFQMGNEAAFHAWDKYAVLRFFAFGMLGMIVAVRKLPELDDLDKDLLKMGRRRGAEMKVIDISAIIDGRVIDICDTKFLTGSIIVPRFVLSELTRLSESPDALQRARGRRGLDVLARMQENQDVPLRVLDKDIPEIPEIEGKIVRLARDLGARVITTDFSLNKVASLENVVCMNVNDLGTALKPVVLPGETMGVYLMKDGKEREQGIGYLDDGTMVVVEDGRRHIGKRVDISVTSLLQTSQGRMIFGKAKGEKASA